MDIPLVRLGAATVSYTGHILDGFVELRCCAGCMWRSGHDHQRTASDAIPGRLERRVDVCIGGVNQLGHLAGRVAVSN